MTKIEFHHRILSIINSTYRYYFAQRRILLKTLKEEKLSRKYYRDYKTFINSLKDYKYALSFTYKDAVIMYDALDGRDWEFQDNKIVLHYPEVEMEQGNIINDIYFRFNPTILRLPSMVISPDLTALRSTYTAIEYKTSYCHPHIRFRIPSYGFHDSICFGDTKFEFSSNIALNFISYLDYLDTFIKHEWDSNPYIHTSTLIEATKKTYKVEDQIDLAKLDFKFAAYKGREYIVIDYTEKSIAYLDSLNFPIYSYNLNGLTFGELEPIREEGESYGELFKNEPILLKIIKPTKRVYDAQFAEKFNTEILHQLTAAYVEAFGADFRQSSDTSTVSVQEDILGGVGSSTPF